ncbi:hypothetical protein [Myxococcus sp. RHSTA-1-4]|uniref:hypothetical protein n=1 Tax=Myxococcus sp. RHSTA-1-4 TaxID=2874601 RepID=UPI001CBF7570|nr:hypothetical protein [Myxococcus sp. RHSTA-1-4]MBZ4421289.1 hypothetical protein [Myxococcus sp. RHSTA-1-4]
MWLEKSSERWTARLRPSGWGRYVAAVPLAVWLCGWAVGELFALGALVFTFRELLLPEQLEGAPPTGATNSAEGVVGAILFLGVWLTMWTVGGAASLRALLALLLSEERLSFNPSGVTRWWRVGPWRSERHLKRGELVDVNPEDPGGVLVASLASGETVTLLQSGTVEQRRELAELLRELFALARDEPSLADHTPPGWECERLPNGAWVLGAARHVRRQEVLGWSFAALVLAACAGGLARRMFIAGGDWTGSLFAWVLTVLAALAGLRAWRGHQGRESWEVQRGSLVHVFHGLFHTRHTGYASPKLVLERTVDSDGDASFELCVHSPAKNKRLGSRATTPRGLLHLGYWFARRLDVPLILEPPDLDRPEAPAARRSRG